MLGIDAGSMELWEPDELGGILAHQLRAPLAEDELFPAGRAVVARPTFGEVLRSDSPLLKDLQQIKSFAKAHREGKQMGLPPEVATVIYYAAISAAILIGRREISALSNEACLEGFDWSLKQPWVDSMTRTLLEQGVRTLV